MKSVIICADDFAQSSAIDEAIIQLIQKNRLTATSCMVLSPRWFESAQRLTADIRQKADIGLHLDFTHFGDAHRHTALIARSLFRNLPPKAIKHCIEVQLNRFEKALGTAPDYVDGHQHVHQLPQIREALLDVLTTRYSQQLPWIRIARPPVNDGLKAKVISSLGASALEKAAKRMDFRCSGDLLGVYDFSGTSVDYKNALNFWLSNVDSTLGTPVLMCHPATAKMEGELSDPIYFARLIEYSVLDSDAMDGLLQKIKLSRSPQDC